MTRHLQARAVDRVLSAALQIAIAVAGVWAGLVAVATAVRVPRHAVRNETCAAARAVLGVREEEALGGRAGTLGYHALKTQVTPVQQIDSENVLPAADASCSRFDSPQQLTPRAADRLGKRAETFRIHLIQDAGSASCSR